jgi:hypothetical protein
MRIRLYAVLLLLALGFVLVLAAGQRSKRANSGDDSEPSKGLDGIEATGLEGGLIEDGPARMADVLNDAVDCLQTLAPTGQALPPTIDIVEVLWEGAGDQVTYEIRFATDDLPAAVAELAVLGEGDFIGFSIEFLDPGGSLTSDLDTGWVPERMGNLSLNLIRDPDTGVFSGALFELKSGSWQQSPGVEYPVEMTADSFIMTVPASDIPSRARGFIVSTFFDASASEVFCDLAAIDEELLGEHLSLSLDNFLSGIVFNISAGREPSGELPYLLPGPDEFN